MAVSLVSFLSLGVQPQSPCAEVVDSINNAFTGITNYLDYLSRKSAGAKNNLFDSLPRLQFIQKMSQKANWPY